MSQPTVPALTAVEIQSCSPPAPRHPQGRSRTASISSDFADGAVSALSSSEEVSSCGSVRNVGTTIRHTVLVYSAHQRGHFDDLEASEAVARRLHTFKYNERTDTSNSCGISGPLCTGSPASLGRSQTRYQSFPKSIASGSATRKMLKLNTCESVIQPLGSLSLRSKRNPRSISARAAAAFRTTDAAVSGVAAATIVLKGAAVNKKLERDIEQRRNAIAKILSPERAINRSKLLALRFPAIQKHNEDKVFLQQCESSQLFDVAWRGPGGEVLRNIQPVQTTGISDRFTEDLSPGYSSTDCDKEQKAGKVKVGHGSLDEAESLTDTERIVAQRTNPVLERQVQSPTATAQRLTESNIDICDLVDLDEVLSTHGSSEDDCCGQWQLPQGRKGPGYERFNADGDSHCSYGASVVSGSKSQGPVSDSLFPSDADQLLGVPRKIIETIGSRRQAQPHNVQIRTPHLAFIPMTPDTAISLPHMVEVPDSEDEDGFASDVDTFDLIQTTDADIAVRNSAHRDTRLLQRDRARAWNQWSSLSSLTSLPLSSLATTPRWPLQSLGSQSRGMATAVKRSSTRCLEKGPRKTDRAENANLATSAYAQLESLSAAQLRNILKRWGFKPPRSKKDMISHILHYYSKIRTTTTSNDTSECEAKSPNRLIMSPEGIKTATMDRISRHIREAESARGWWMKILTYEPILVEDLAQFLEKEGMLAGTQKYDLAVIKEWCDSQSICMVSKDGPGETRKRR
ncbi:hypothetical protein V1517DRAFT_45907 [Lipomyces orientalis]|uniref:Uncharacterized protein n=1 Tax=Lipomyces orientalis TaxID=1233043 RepID=A0ACC3TTZ3_9ASCO